jgi:hypothetical protein
MSKERTLPEASYIKIAREIVRTVAARKEATDTLKTAKRLCATTMHSAGVTNFAFDVEGKRYKANLTRKIKQKTDIQRLYMAVRAETITLDEFLRCVTVNDETVLDLFGQDFFDTVSTHERGPIDLHISPVK